MKSEFFLSHLHRCSSTTQRPVLCWALHKEKELVPAQKSSESGKAKKILRLRRDHHMKTFLVVLHEKPPNSTPSPSYSSQILSADNSSNVARKEHSIHRDKQRIIQTAFNYGLGHSDEMEKLQDLVFAPGLSLYFLICSHS